jgi:uracil-DNA glycosylase
MAEPWLRRVRATDPRYLRVTPSSDDDGGRGLREGVGQAKSSSPAPPSLTGGRSSNGPEPTGATGGAWEALSAEIRSCERCELHRTRTQAVVYRGGERPRLVFVGEAPGAEEDRQGVPFVGRSGRRLDEGIARLGLEGEEFGIVNLLKCRPPANVFSRPAEAACRPYLDRQLALLAPHLVVPLGAHALATLDPTAPKITEAAGVPRVAGPWTLFPLLHPAATFRSRRNLELWERDLDRLRARLAHR